MPIGVCKRLEPFCTTAARKKNRGLILIFEKPGTAHSASPVVPNAAPGEIEIRVILPFSPWLELTFRHKYRVGVRHAVAQHLAGDWFGNVFPAKVRRKASC